MTIKTTTVRVPVSELQKAKKVLATWKSARLGKISLGELFRLGRERLESELKTEK